MMEYTKYSGPFGNTMIFNKLFNRICPFQVYIIDNGTIAETVEKITPGSDCSQTDLQCLVRHFLN